MSLKKKYFIVYLFDELMDNENFIVFSFITAGISLIGSCFYWSYDNLTTLSHVIYWGFFICGVPIKIVLLFVLPYRFLEDKHSDWDDYRRR